jgi:hypothetical protein
MRRKYSVLSFSRQYKYPLPVKKIFLLAVFLLPAIIVVAQYEDQPDSAIIEAVPDEEELQDASDQKQYFLPKWMADSNLDSFRLRRLPDTAIASLKKDAAFWYADSVFRNLQRELQDQQEQSAMNPKQNQGKNRQQADTERSSKKYSSVSDRSWFQGLLWIIVIGGFLAVVILYLINRNVQLFRKPAGNISTGEDEVETEDIFAINYQKEIDKAAASKNYRLAIRLMFLRLLKNMAQRNIIQYKPDRTNFDYLMQLSTTKYYQDFFRITRNYEYSWYGKFDVNDEAYKIIRQDFEQFDPTTK